MKCLKILLATLLVFSLNASCVYATTADYYDIGFAKVNDVYVNRLGVEIPKAVARGIDVSQYQGVIDWAQVASDDVTFAFIRCGSSLSGPDTMFDTNCEQALANNIPIGIYYYTQGVTDDYAQTEIDYILECAKRHKITLPVVLDIEGQLMASIGYTQLQSTIALFCDAVKKAGYTPMVYASTSFMNTHIRNCDCDKWIAQYGDYLEYTGDNVKYWQCTSHGYIKGIEGRVDINLKLEDDLAEVVYITKPKDVQDKVLAPSSSKAQAPSSGNMYTRGDNVLTLNR